MPGADIAQHGIAFFTVACMVFLVAQWFKQKSDHELADVIKNNTNALEQLTTLIQVALTRQEAKIDELLERARR